MTIGITALVFLVVLFVLILVHEWGHFITAKKTGMRVDEFGIGFPPKLFGYKKGETEYTLNALPIGGFVRIYGEDPTQIGEDPDKERAFSSRPKWAQAIVLVAGVTMNIVLAWFLFVVVFILGVPTAVSEEDAGPTAALQVVEIVSGSVVQGQLPLNARITSISIKADETQALENPTPRTLTEFVQTAGPVPLVITYTLGERTEALVATPQAGLLTEQPEQVALGIRTALVEEIRYGFWAAIQGATRQTLDALVLIVVSIAGLLYNTVTGTADLSQVAGPVGIFNLVGDAATVGLTSLLLFTAVISLNLAIINLFPFPALDGGRLVLVAIEALMRRPVDPIWTARLNLVGFVLLIGLMIAVTYNDILRLI